MYRDPEGYYYHVDRAVDAVALGGGQWLYTALSEERSVTRFAPTDFREPPVAVARLKPPEGFSTKDARARRHLARMQSPLDTVLLAQRLQSDGVDVVDIARLRYRSGEQTIVGDAINRALAIDPRDPDALSLQAQLVRDSRGLAASIPWFERAVEVAPDNVALLGDYAAVLGELGEYREMLAVVRRMFELDPREHRLHYEVVSNATLWFLYHGLFDLPRTARVGNPVPGARDA
jgi:tetratricopeptide (TPR) repeat protein